MRVAIFVDAGYLYTAGSVILTGSRQSREVMELNQEAVIENLQTLAQELAIDRPLLRIYWYDGLLGGQRSWEQRRLAVADNVKLRLGTVTGGQQKGVDSLIVTDLIELARNHAISDAVLLSGDEDLRIGVQIAQSFGVRVHLMGIQPSRGNQSNLLREEADTTTEWSREHIEAILSVKHRDGVVTVTSPNLDHPGNHIALTSETLNDVAEKVANSINVSGWTNADLELLSSTIPPEHDRVLLSESGRRLGRDLEQSEKRQIRELFRERLRRKVEGT